MSPITLFGSDVIKSLTGLCAVRKNAPRILTPGRAHIPPLGLDLPRQFTQLEP
jgi:hypothetical protein